MIHTGVFYWMSIGFNFKGTKWLKSKVGVLKVGVILCSRLKSGTVRLVREGILNLYELNGLCGVVA